MKTTGWILFKDKLPYQTVFGGEAPYDYMVIVCLGGNIIDVIELEKYNIHIIRKGKFNYFLSTASYVTKLYKQDELCQKRMICWTTFEEYEE